MKRIFYALLVIVGFFILAFFFEIINNKEKSKSNAQRNYIRECMEFAYFEGQKDAINEDVRIKKNEEGCYVWAKNCWDDTTIHVQYIPPCNGN